MLEDQLKTKYNFYQHINFLLQWKIVMEIDIYLEKIIDSIISWIIPIYYGDYTLDEYINPKSIILIKNDKDIKEKIEYIKKLI